MKTIILIIGIGSATIAQAVNVAGDVKALHRPIAVSGEEVKKAPPTAPAARDIILAGPVSQSSDVQTEDAVGSTTFDTATIGEVAATIGEVAATNRRHDDAGWKVHQAIPRL